VHAPVVVLVEGLALIGVPGGILPRFLRLGFLLTPDARSGLPLKSSSAILRPLMLSA